MSVLKIDIVCVFRNYNHIVCDDKKQLWQLECCPGKRTIPLRKLTFNPTRNAYRINSLWVSKKQLLRLKIEKKYILTFGTRN